MDRQQAADIAAQLRRCLEDVLLFEGEDFIAPEDRPLSSEVVPVAAESPLDKGQALADFHQSICQCMACPLGKSRTKFVFGDGNPDADVLFIGEAPGAQEDRQGLPFVGAAGQLLDKIIGAMGFTREQVYICNMLKCRPPNNRDPAPEELAACEPYLKEQIGLIEPQIICTLGRVAAQALLRSNASMGRLRGQVHNYQGIPVVATYHPAALLRNPQWKRATWEDVKRLRREYDGVEL